MGFHEVHLRMDDCTKCFVKARVCRIFCQLSPNAATERVTTSYHEIINNANNSGPWCTSRNRCIIMQWFKSERLWHRRWGFKPYMSPNINTIWRNQNRVCSAVLANMDGISWTSKEKHFHWDDFSRKHLQLWWIDCNRVFIRLVRPFLNNSVFDRKTNSSLWRSISVWKGW